MPKAENRTVDVLLLTPGHAHDVATIAGMNFEVVQKLFREKKLAGVTAAFSHKPCRKGSAQAGGPDSKGFQQPGMGDSYSVRTYASNPVRESYRHD